MPGYKSIVLLYSNRVKSYKYTYSIEVNKSKYFNLKGIGIETTTK